MKKLDVWEVRDFKGTKNRYTCDIYRNGKRVIGVTCDCPEWRPIYHSYSGKFSTVLKFIEEAELWGLANNADSLIEIEDKWVLFHAAKVPKHITAERFINSTK